MKTRYNTRALFSGNQHKDEQYVELLTVLCLSFPFLFRFFFLSFPFQAASTYAKISPLAVNASVEFYLLHSSLHLKHPSLPQYKPNQYNPLISLLELNIQQIYCISTLKKKKQT